jgi:hypothetical protein
VVATALAGRRDSRGPPSTGAPEGAPDPKCAVQACPLVIGAMCEVLRPLHGKSCPRPRLQDTEIQQRKFAVQSVPIMNLQPREWDTSSCAPAAQHLGGNFLVQPPAAHFERGFIA